MPRSVIPIRRPSRLGYTGPGGGYMSWVESPTEYRGTTVQVCGLWPFGTGSSTPTIGAPLGRHRYTNATVCFDPISWYERAKLINNPSVWIQAEPAMGKSTSVRRMLLSLVAQGVTPLILGDLKPDYAELVAALGGRVLRVGPGLHRINPLDIGPWQQVLAHVRDPKEIEQLHAEIVDRRLNAALVLATLTRGAPLASDEITVLAAALRFLTERESAAQPLLSDVLRVIEEAPMPVRWVTLWHDDHDLDRYRLETENLRRTLRALIHGPLGSTVEGHTTASIDLDTTALCVDISGISETNQMLTAATLVTTWAAGFGQVEAAHRMSDLGLAPPRRFFLVLDEMWRALRVGHGMVDRIDALTRLNRSKGTGTAFITHSLGDLQALPNEEDRAKARGFADRCAVLMIGACSEQELDAVARVRPLAQAERAEVLSWSAPPSWTTGPDEEEVLIGRGNFLIKVGTRPGIPVHLEPTEIEKQLGNTDFRWRRT
ncbi:AAA-like domain-containing protein [Micromonospora sediminicola]|uniref:AAA-like domain-containing protein n=2 Tax=Micromonospora TaxID=1873 RepID=A0A1A9BIK4_9ACTN|nr:ATP/GTP-binding protein [Micromonospora sediminicola]PGH43684.1 ATP/GTP-binding protein [Micromonospora sp. WMMA1996]SBT69018.1 AAA-like domain-containing protein [Micromonospora sediminicola]